VEIVKAVEGSEDRTDTESHVSLEPDIHVGLFDEGRLCLTAPVLEFELGTVRQPFMHTARQIDIQVVDIECIGRSL
jgi:hypothetical protein